MSEFVTLTPHGRRVSFMCREDTTDAMTVNACCTEDEYKLPAMTGWALDVGAHIGGATIAMLADNPDLRVIAIEALPENAELLRQNLDLNGFTTRATVWNAAASSSGDLVRIVYGDGAGGDFGRMHRFIGNGDWHDGQTYVEVPPISLGTVVQSAGQIDFMKIDCEGGEWSFLDDPAVSKVHRIVGEFHPRDGNGPARLHELLDATHVVTVDETLGFGPFSAVLRWEFAR